MLHRLFVGLSIPDDSKKLIARTVEPLKEEWPAARFLPPKNWHATISFLAEQSDDDIRKISIANKEVAEAFPSPELRFEKFIFAPPSRAPTMLWALGDRETSRALGEIKEWFDERLVDLGVRFKRENYRQFTAHITLAKWERGGIEAKELPKFAVSFTAPSIELFESVKEKDAREYITLGSFEFEGDGIH